VSSEDADPVSERGGAGIPRSSERGPSGPAPGAESGEDVLEPLVVPEALAGERIDRVVAMLTGWSRSEVQSLVESGAVLVGGATVGKSRKLRAGEVVEVVGAPPQSALPGPEPVEVDVRYEDPDVLVVSKPAGLVVHPGAGHADGTLVNGLLSRYPEIAGVGDPARPGIVHRLDRDTSGLMLVARSAAAYDGLVAALASHAVERRYRALVWGRPAADRGVVDAPIGRSVRRPTRMAVREAGREARTGYTVLRAYEDPAVTLLECRLETGRTHQIRAHLASLGAPLLGDPRYGGPRRVGEVAVPRVMLHALRLEILHPASGERLAFTAPVPEDFASVERALVP
jgi:23S rRNA pseudouridine1911/1915/1917 synthase